MSRRHHVHLHQHQHAHRHLHVSRTAIIHQAPAQPASPALPALPPSRPLVSTMQSFSRVYAPVRTYAPVSHYTPSVTVSSPVQRQDDGLGAFIAGVLGALAVGAAVLGSSSRRSGRR